MSAAALEWANLLIRWFHVIAGIWWIGSSLYFVWLDNSFEPLKVPEDGVEGEVWMVHGGFFYKVEKRLMQPGKLPETLHWFKWEATFTWISGILLLMVVYYMTGGAYLIDPQVAAISLGQAIALSLGLIIGSWVIYDLFWQSSFAKNKPGAATIVSLLFLGGLIYTLCHSFTGRAAFIHVGAILGTIMVANVWVRILPGQQAMLDAATRGEVPDYTAGKNAKHRSLHNSYVTFPVIFMMISNHYPNTFEGPHNWINLLLLMVFGAGIRHFMITKEAHNRDTANWVWAPVAASLAALIFLTAPPAPPPQADTGEEVAFSTVQTIVSQRCLSCHSSSPSDDIFRSPPNGVVLETPDQIKAFAERIKIRAVDSKSMPLGNKTEMTDEEREVLGRWIAQQGS